MMFESWLFFVDTLTSLWKSNAITMCDFKKASPWSLKSFLFSDILFSDAARTYTDEDIKQLKSDRDYLACDMVQVRSTLDDLVMRYRSGQAGSLHDVMAELIELANAIED